MNQAGRGSIGGEPRTSRLEGSANAGAAITRCSPMTKNGVGGDFGWC